MSQRVINIRDARVRTMAVGIKAMSISDKQVTLAVFRQLFEEDLIADDGHLNGLPWGIINYCPSKNCFAQNGSGHVILPSRLHHHIVWQKDDELRRATVAKTPSFVPYQSKTAKDYIAAIHHDQNKTNQSDKALVSALSRSNAPGRSRGW